MCYGNPEKLLQVILDATPLAPNALGHTPLDDFEHFCAVTGCTVETAGEQAVAWAKVAFISALMMSRS
jgi:hypothetical protein